MKPKAFQFKHFSLKHEQSAHKIGTDSILLSTWLEASNPKRILDLGSGCGVITFILAQRFPKALIDGVEIDESSYREGLQNLKESNFQKRIQFYNNDLLHFSSKNKYDLIVSNPPYFEEDTRAPDLRRAKARRLERGALVQYLKKAKELLSSQGLIALVLPVNTWTNNHLALLSLGLYPHRLFKVQHQKGKPFKRIVVELGQQKEIAIEGSISLYEDDGISRSTEYQNLCGDFLLDQ